MHFAKSKPQSVTSASSIARPQLTSVPPSPLRKPPRCLANAIEGGLVSQLEVIDAERTALEKKRELTRSRANRRLAAITLIQALGGGWTKP